MRATGLVLRPTVLLPEYGRFLGELCGSVVRIRGQRKMWGSRVPFVGLFESAFAFLSRLVRLLRYRAWEMGKNGLGRRREGSAAGRSATIPALQNKRRRGNHESKDSPQRHRGIQRENGNPE